ncbi:transposase [Desulfobacca acetoxidans]
MRKRYDASFKAKIALEVVKSLKTVNEIATEAGVHPAVITKWKRQLRNVSMILRHPGSIISVSLLGFPPCS